MVSVIVPVYKAEKYLRRCIDSVLAQTYEDWELILVDDGSPDSSGKICDEYAQKDSRISVYHKENGGVSSARNMGLDNAKGDFICFLDSDDYFSKDYLRIALDSTCDLVVVESAMHRRTGLIEPLEQLNPCKSSNETEYKSILERSLVRGVMRGVLSKIIRRKTIGDVRFLIGQNIGEDTLFHLQVYKKAKSIEIKSGAVYYYQQDVIDDTCKYRLTPEKSIQFVGNIYTAYKALDIHSVAFEGFLLTYYFDLCDKHKAYKLWFNAPIIKEIQSKVPNLLPIYQIWRFCPIIAPAFEKLYVFLAKIKRIVSGL